MADSVDGNVDEANSILKGDIENIIKRLTLHEEFNHMTYVGKMYSKADLVKDLRKLLEVLNG